jgi:hypothetical protein
MIEFDNIDSLIRTLNRDRAYPKKGVIGHMIKINNVAKRPIESSRWSKIIEDGVIVGRYRKIVGFEDLK